MSVFNGLGGKFMPFALHTESGTMSNTATNRVAAAAGRTFVVATQGEVVDTITFADDPTNKQLPMRRVTVCAPVWLIATVVMIVPSTWAQPSTARGNVESKKRVDEAS